MTTGNAPTHTCSYFCDKPECIKAQRDELRDKLAALESQPVPVEPVTFDHFTNGDSRDDFGPVVDGRYVLKSDYDALQSAQKLAQEERDKFKDYWLAIDNRMVVLHLGTADSFDADTCMNIILEWETTIALDPQVSRPARELKDTHLQHAEKAESINRRMVELLKEPSECFKKWFLSQIPSGTVISNPEWWIPRIHKAMSAELLKEVDK